MTSANRRSSCFLTYLKLVLPDEERQVVFLFQIGSEMIGLSNAIVFVALALSDEHELQSESRMAGLEQTLSTIEASVGK